MTTTSYPSEDDWEDDDWPPADSGDSTAQDAVVLVELAVVVFAVLVTALLGWAASSLFSYSGQKATTGPALAAENKSITEAERPISLPLFDPAAIVAPYDAYIVTQGVHGLSYGHMAIDIAAGKGAPIKSPISGEVSELYFDTIGNSTLVIENDRYAVTFLHGVYSVAMGDTLQIGDEIGKEGNLGNTRDMQGHSCRDRDCGYHTHLNIFDKAAGSNINPLTVIGN